MQDLLHGHDDCGTRLGTEKFERIKSIVSTRELNESKLFHSLQLLEAYK